MEDKKLSRRDFLKGTGAFVGMKFLNKIKAPTYRQEKQEDHHVPDEVIDQEIRGVMGDYELLTRQELVSDLSKKGVVAFGEKHNSIPDMEYINLLLKDLHDTGRPLVLASERFGVSEQTKIDEIQKVSDIQDRSAALTNFFKDSDYARIWGKANENGTFPSVDAFQELISFAVENNIPIIALENYDLKNAADPYKERNPFWVNTLQQKLLDFDRKNPPLVVAIAGDGHMGNSDGSFPNLLADSDFFKAYGEVVSVQPSSLLNMGGHLRGNQITAVQEGYTEVIAKKVIHTTIPFYEDLISVRDYWVYTNPIAAQDI